ncbi:protein kinase [Planctomycetota bacterium]
MSSPSTFGAEPEGIDRLLALGLEETNLDEAAPTTSWGGLLEKSGVQVGQKLGHFTIQEMIGRGGMGVVYLARDTRLERTVAIKSMPPELIDNATARTRFQREAKLLASLSHPNIAVIHEIIEEAESGYLVLEYIPGQTLAEHIAKGPLKLQEALTIALQIAEAMAAAHDHDVIHRDLKPGNIKITTEGKVKVLDFGLAKTSVSSSTSTEPTVTQAGRVLGTPAYMSPEQARGKSTDLRTDIWSFGCIMYEMLTGNVPFEGETATDTIAHIIEREPNWDALPAEAGPQLRKVLHKCLEKDPDGRYQSAAQILQDLYSYQATLSAKAFDIRLLWQAIRRPRVAVYFVLILLTLGFSLSWLLHRSTEVRWARVEAIPEIERFIEQDKYLAAFSLARQAEKYIPEDPMLKNLWPRFSGDISINTTSPAADIYFREYSTIEDGWEYLGRSPLENIRFPSGAYRFKITKEGYETREFVTGAKNLNVELWQAGWFPSGMVRIPPLGLRTNPFPLRYGVLETPGYWIDKYEITNQQFKEFVDKGGYQNRTHWKHPFVKDGKDLSWEQALAEFRDKTGRPGPSTWEAGIYPNGQDQYPVSGVSWYEAAAYAEFAGKSLPTICHWSGGARLNEASVIIPLSNLEGDGLAPVGSFPGMGTTGLYDMAGNVKEWCFNATNDLGDQRYILGGAWSEPTYMFTSTDSRSPWDRSIVNGFRCVQYPDGIEAMPDVLFHPIERPSVIDFTKVTPISDEELQLYKKLYAYDGTELNAVVEEVNENSAYWRKERITFDAAYGGERVATYLFLPKGVKPPYQTVVYFPGGGYFRDRSSVNMQPRILSQYIIMSGRALMWPIYRGSFERNKNVGDLFSSSSQGFDKPNAYRDWVIHVSKDLGRSIDYLETRDDIDHEKIAYYGTSRGARLGPIMLTIEARIKAGVFLAGGFTPLSIMPPAADPINFAPRVTVPIIMINGREDSIFPVEISQIPMYELLGTSDEDKAHKIYPGGHGLLVLFRRQVRNDILDWLDRYLGPVE